METPKTIKSLLKIKQISQKELANRIGKSEVAVSQILNGKYSPHPKTMDEISEVLGVPVPVITFLSLEESDIPKAKREVFKLLKPSIINLLDEVFNLEEK